MRLPLALLLVVAPSGVEAKCVLRSALEARTAGETKREEPLELRALAPRHPVKRLIFQSSKEPIHFVAGDLACPVNEPDAARLFAPFTGAAQVEELFHLIEPGQTVPSEGVAALIAEHVLEKAPAGAPAKGLEVTPEGQGFVARALVARATDGGAELAQVTLHLAREGQARREESLVLSIAPPPELAPAYVSSSPVRPAARGEAFKAQREAHEQRVAAFWRAIAAARPKKGTP